jgi:hypothetical protein
MRIIEFSSRDKYRVQQFNDLPFRIYEDVPQWVPPLSIDINQIFDTKKNPFYKHSEATFFLVVTNDGSPVGRLAVLNNHNYNEHNHSKTAFFCLFECFNDKQAAKELFTAAFKWARKNDLDSIEGPRGFTALDGLGLLINGFEHRPAFGITYNLPYYQELVEAAGFIKVNDIVSGYLNSSIQFPENIHKISQLVQHRRGLRIINFRSKRELRQLVPQIKTMYNESLDGTTDNVPLTSEEIDKVVDQIIWFANPRLIKVIQKDEKLVGYLFAYPDITEAIQKTNGKVFPIGWISMLREMKKTKWVNVNGAAIIEEYQGLGGTAILFSEMQKSIIEGGFIHADIVQIGVENEKMQRELRNLGIDFYKTHRMYRLNL